MKLIPNKYYLHKHESGNSHYYKFKNMSDKHVHFYNFDFVKHKDVIRYNLHGYIRYDIEYFNKCLFEEIDPIILLDYFPIDHPDRKIILRKIKICNLLKI